MKILRNLFFIAAFALAAAGIIIFIQGQRSADAQEQASDVIDQTNVRVDSLRVTIGATSALQPIRQVGLRFQLPSIVSEVLVREGETVIAGQLLARVEADELASALRDAELLRDIRRIALDALLAPPRSEDIAVAQAALDAAQAQLNASYSTGSPQADDIAALQAELARNALYQAQLQRDLAVNPPAVTITQAIPGGGTITQEVQPPGADPEQFEPGLEQAQFGVEIADARAVAALDNGADIGSVSSAQAGVIAAQTTLDRLVNGADELDIRLAELELAQAEQGVALAQANLDRALLTAPFGGVIAQLNITAGEPAPAQDAAALLIDTEGFYLDLPVDESDIARIQVGQPVEISLDALPDVVLMGTITRLPVAPQPQLPGQQVVTYLVRVSLDPTDQPLRAQMTATASIIVDSLSEALVLPSRFVRIDRDSGLALVTILSEAGEYEEIPVVLGVRNETEVQIVSGLAEGDEVYLLPRAVFNPVGAGGPPQ
jgi:HlyD family secretion protein